VSPVQEGETVIIIRIKLQPKWMNVIQFSHMTLKRCGKTDCGCISVFDYEQDCAICCEQLTDPSGYEQLSSSSNAIQLASCKHQFHKACVFAMYQSGTKVS
jgi:Zinc finger, C3HC4 type (RING finger)